MKEENEKIELKTNKWINEFIHGEWMNEWMNEWINEWIMGCYEKSIWGGLGW